MKIVGYVLSHRALFWVLMLLCLIGGAASYATIGKLESPSFKIKKAMVAAQYPGASPAEVEREVTDKLEEAIQKMSQVDNVTSVSRAGFCVIMVETRDEISGRDLEQCWDELRRKVNDVMPYLPPGVAGVSVRDDFADVYGIFLALYGEGCGPDELSDYADGLKKELLRVPQTAKVTFWGEQDRKIYVEFDRARLSGLGISQKAIFAALEGKNAIADAGGVRVGEEYSRLRVSGAVDGPEQIRSAYVPAADGSLVRIGDIAQVRRGHAEPPSQIMTYNGMPCIGIGISIVEGGNVVALGRDVKALLKKLEPSMPAGMGIGFVNYQAEDVQRSINGFMVNLLESVAIVIGILLITMGVRSGIVIGLTLILIMLGTFIGMKVAGIDMQIVSLGSLIIALGMLVDNAIVIVDGCLVKISSGRSTEEALKSIAGETMWPLLGATLVAILAFGAIGLNQNMVGEFCKSLFSVITISLSLSWIMALTFTPLLCQVLLRRDPAAGSEAYSGRVYGMYRRLLERCLRFRWAAFALMLILLAASAWGFGSIPQSFFPDSTRTKFHIDYWRDSASHIEETAKDVRAIADWVRTLPGVESAATFAGEGGLRFLLAYDYNTPSPDFGQIVVSVKDAGQIDALIPQVEAYLAGNYPEADSVVMRFTDAIDLPFKVGVRFSGPDEAVLRRLAEQAKQILRNSGNARYIRDNWRPPVKVLRAQFSDLKAGRAAVSRSDVAAAMLWNYTGVVCGALREGNKLVPVISRSAPADRQGADGIAGVRVVSSVTGRSYQLSEVTDGVATAWEHTQIRHRDRVPAITVQASPCNGTAETLRRQVLHAMQAIELPPLYSMAWDGEYHYSQKAEAPLIRLFPLFFLGMFLVTMMLFRTLREPLIAFLAIPFSLIGVAGGLLATGQSFGFMSLLGFLGLTGMLLKNCIVLLDQIGLERSRGTEPYEALVKASVSRLRSVTMAAGTTVLGMLPLLFDAFFAAMACVIVFGLVVATLLTLIFVPAAYAVFFRVRVPSFNGKA